MHLHYMRRNKLEAVQWCHPLALRRLALATFILSLPVLMPQTASASELLTNGNFSTGDLTGWNTYTNYAGAWSAYSGSTVNGVTVPTPSGYGAVTDQGTIGGGAHVLYQNFVVPTDATALNVSFQMFIWNPSGIQWMELHSFATQANHQEAWVEILQPGADATSISAPVQYALYHTQDGFTNPSPTGFTTVNASVPTFTPGATYTLRFVEVNNSPAGAVYMGLQNVSALATTGGGSGGTGGDTGGQAPEPGTLILIGSGCIAFSLWRRKIKTAAATA
jgi:hypothetical protein